LNLAKYLYGRAPQGERLVQKVPHGNWKTVTFIQTPIEYLNSGWIENVEAGSAEELSINGFPAATATAKGDQKTFRAP
jgi:predicted Zn-dependent protease